MLIHYYYNTFCVDGYNVTSASLHEMPIASEKQRLQQEPEVVYSVVNLANQTKRDNEDNKDGAPSPGIRKIGSKKTLNGILLCLCQLLV